MNLAPNLANIPPALLAYPNWVWWKHITRMGKQTKPPYIAGTSSMAATDDPRTWCDFTTATAKLNGNGLGFVCSPRPGIAFVDLDQVRDATSRAWLFPWAERIVRQIPSYAEFSPSGTGVHIYARWRSPNGASGHNLKPTEIYFRTHFATVTGDHVPDTPLDIKAVDLNWLYRLIVARVFQFTPGSRYDLLFNRGDVSEYGDDSSRADLALCGLLAGKFCNAQDIDNAVRLSALYREKWERPDYREATIAKALAEGLRVKPFKGLTPSSQSSTQLADWQSKLLVGKDGKIRPLLANLREILRNHPQWRGVLGFDEFAQKVWLLKEPPWGGSAAREWSNDDDHKTVCWSQQDGGITANLAHIIADAVSTTARENAFHPVRKYFNKLKWDHVPRAEKWLSSYLGAVDTEYTRAVGPRWLRSAVARIFRPGCQADHILLLQGNQGILKSTALRTLAGDWFCDHLDGQQMGDKDSRLALRGVLICEWGEMAHVRQQELERTKNYLTVRVDRYRPPYGRQSEEYPRQCVFAATTNKEMPLQDMTGNRRFWPVTCGRIDMAALQRDRDQLWAEVASEYHDGKPWWLETPELSRIVEAEQEERLEQSAWTDQILDWCERPEQLQRIEAAGLYDVTPWFGSKPGQINVQDVMRHCLKLPERDFERAKLAVAEVLRKAGWCRKQKPVEGRRRWYYVREKPAAKPF